MPTYGYRCPSCGHEFEVFQRMTDEPAAACPECAAPARRVFFPAGIVFKGSGFYKTDSRKSESNGSPAPTAAPAKDKPTTTTASEPSTST